MFNLNREQAFVVEKAVEWYNGPDQVFQYMGGPGTGKTTILFHILSRLELNIETEVAAMTFTGAAALNMTLNGLPGAKTIHSWLYDVKEEFIYDDNGNHVIDEVYGTPKKKLVFIPVESLPPEIKLIVIDEGYCTPKKMDPQIRKFGVKMLICGDPRQLPPVGDSPAYLTDNSAYKLTQPMRQASCADINIIASEAGDGIVPYTGLYQNTLVITQREITDDMLLWADMIICSRNKTRDVYNNRVRTIKGYSGKLPHFGEKVICRKNNWQITQFSQIAGKEISLTNGLIGTVMNEPDVSSMSGKTDLDTTFELYFRPDMVPDIVFRCRVNYAYMTGNCFDRKDLSNNTWTKGELFEFGYAITTYISQGSQANRILYIEEKMPDQSRLNLVGSSRAKQFLIYAKPF